MIIWWSSVIYLTQTTNKQTIWLSVYWQIPSLGTVSINVALYRVYWQMPSLGTVLVNVAFERVHWQIPSLGTVLVNVAFERMYWQIPSLGTVSINVALCRMYWQIPSLGTVLVIVAFERVSRQIPPLGTSTECIRDNIDKCCHLQSVLADTINRDSIGKCWPLSSDDLMLMIYYLYDNKQTNKAYHLVIIWWSSGDHYMII